MPDRNITAIEVSQKHQRSLARNIISAKFNWSQLLKTVTPLKEDGSLILYSWKRQKKEKQLSGIPPRTL